MDGQRSATVALWNVPKGRWLFCPVLRGCLGTEQQGGRSLVRHEEVEGYPVLECGLTILLSWDLQSSGRTVAHSVSSAPVSTMCIVTRLYQNHEPFRYVTCLRRDV
jgi:hypothetical protein